MLKKYYDTEHFPDLQNPVVTVGTFDGMHKGHGAILQRLCELAREISGEPVLVSFEPHPRIALKKDHEHLKLLNSPEEKAELLEKAGIRHLVVIPFTEAFSNLTEQEFIRQYLLDKLHVSRLVVGYDHRFGHNRQGNYVSLTDYAAKYGFRVEEMPRQDIGAVTVSSTQIRNAISAGNVSHANEMLGYSYPLKGTVVEGNRLGHKIGFPTANLSVLYPYKLIPARGVYAVRVVIGRSIYKGMCNIGVKPTFDGRNEVIEANIFDFNADLYGKNIKILFAGRLRDERKFDNVGLLTKQLYDDRIHALHLLKEHNV